MLVSFGVEVCGGDPGGDKSGVDEVARGWENRCSGETNDLD